MAKCKPLAAFYIHTAWLSPLCATGAPQRAYAKIDFRAIGCPGTKHYNMTVVCLSFLLVEVQVFQWALNTGFIIWLFIFSLDNVGEG